MAEPEQLTKPIRIKLYGLMYVTRRGYLTQLGFAVALLLGLLTIWLLLPPLPGADELTRAAPGMALALPVLRNLPWIAAGLLVLFGVEAWWVLRKFARAEAGRRPA